MYGIFTNICPINDPNVGKYTINGAYGIWVQGMTNFGSQTVRPVRSSAHIALPSIKHGNGKSQLAMFDYREGMFIVKTTRIIVSWHQDQKDPWSKPFCRPKTASEVATSLFLWRVSPRGEIEKSDLVAASHLDHFFTNRWPFISDICSLIGFDPYTYVSFICCVYHLVI